jgi:ELWxxDGT repeat protein
MKKLTLAIFTISIAYLPSHAQSPQLIDDITPGANATSFSESIACNGKLIFTAGSQLWVSDGTAPGTSILKTFASGPYPTQLFPAGGGLYFKSFNTSKVNIWYFNGTDSTGISQISYHGSNVTISYTLDIDKLSASPFTLVSDNLYFAGYYYNTIGTELYKLTVNPNGVAFVNRNENTLKI